MVALSAELDAQAPNPFPHPVFRASIQTDLVETLGHGMTERGDQAFIAPRGHPGHDRTGFGSGVANRLEERGRSHPVRTDVDADPAVEPAVGRHQGQVGPGAFHLIVATDEHGRSCAGGVYGLGSIR